MNIADDRKNRSAIALEGENILLRPLRLTDAWQVYRNIKNPEIGKFNIAPPPRYLNGKAGRFVRRSCQLLVKAVSVLCHVLHLPLFRSYVKLGVILKRTGQVIGIASAENIDRNNLTASLGFWIGREYWGQGIMMEAMPLLIDYCFNTLGMHKLWGEAHSENMASLKNCGKLGFQTEGVLREERLINGQRVNIVRIGLFREEWESRREHGTS